ncbi:MAG: nicotinate (nicotinamide) nucleotide adenylyltransferase [Planctomycetota bacterium]|jgi:nicotinate-nucleotide adenylyltransferase
MPVHALFGGSFDPFHNGHRWLVEAVLAHTEAERVWVMPAAAPPHKPGVAISDFPVRLELCLAGVQGLDGVEVSDLEGRRDGPSYTVDTLREMHRLNGSDVRWLLLMGADMAADFPTWRNVPGILDLATPVVALRPGESEPPPIPGALQVIQLPGTPPDVSATEIRARVRAGEPITDLVPPGVAEIIGRRSLYAC